MAISTQLGTVLANALKASAGYVALTTTSSTATTPGTEVTGGSPAYARKAAVNGATTAGAYTITTATPFDIPAGATVTGWALYDAATGGNFLLGGNFPAAQPFASQANYAPTINLATAATS